MPDVILGFDGSPSARAALEVAIEQAQIGGDKLVAIFADEPPGRVVGEEYREHRLILEQMGSGLLDEAATAARERGVEVETMLVPRNPHDALETVSRERGARLIVVGTYSESPLRSAILGSTPHKLLYISDLPVMCVPSNPRGAR